MPSQTNVYANAPQAKSAPAPAKGFLGLFKTKAGPVRGWTTVRTLGHTTRRAARRPVWE